MCDPVSLTLAAVGTVAAVALAPKPPKIGAAPTPEKPPQAAKTPGADIYRQQNESANGPAGAGSTFLTGPLGLAPAATNIGSNTLLGA